MFLETGKLGNFTRNLSKLGIPLPKTPRPEWHLSVCSQEGIQLDGIFKELRKPMAFESSFHRLVAGQPGALKEGWQQVYND